MAKITEELTLVDKFSGAFNKFIDGYQKSAEMAQKTTQATKQMANSANTAITEAARAYQQQEGKIVQVSDATQELIDKLSIYEQAVVHAFTGTQKEEALNRLEKQMNKIGLVFTNVGQEAHASELLMSDGLQELANQGAITANYMVELAHAEKAAAVAAAEAAARAQKFDEIVAPFEAATQAADEFAAAENNAVAASEEVVEKQSKLFGILQSVGNAASNTVSKMMGFKDTANPLDNIMGKLSRMVIYFFSVRKLIGYIRDALKRTPDEIASSFTTLKTTIGDSFARVVVSAIGAMRKGIDRLNQAFQSPAGQKFLRGLEVAAAAAGKVIGFLADGVAHLIEFMGNNFQTVMGVAAAVVGFFAAKMIVAAVSSMIANWQIWLIIAAVAGLIFILNKCGISVGAVFGFIAEITGRLYAFVYNIIADIWNYIAIFAEFLANVFDNPVLAIKKTMGNLFDWLLGLFESIASVIDTIFGSNLQKSVSTWRGNVQKWVDEKVGDDENYKKIARMEKLNVHDTGKAWGSATENFFDSLSDFSLSNMMPTAIKDLDSIDASVGSIEKSVSAAEEDIKSLIDLAERRYVAQVNLTSQTPVINVSGQNTGSTAADRKALADALAEVLVEQASAGSTLSTASAF